MRGIVGRIKPFDKPSVSGSRLHKTGSRIELVTVVCGTTHEIVINVRAVHTLCHHRDCIVIESIFESLRQGPIVSIFGIGKIIWHIPELLVFAYPAIFVSIGSPYTCFKSLVGIKSADSLEICVSYYGRSMISYHHIGLRTPHIPDREPSMLVVE